MACPRLSSVPLTKRCGSAVEEGGGRQANSEAVGTSMALDVAAKGRCQGRTLHTLRWREMTEDVV
jgi:hypothetical protein